MAKKAKKLQRKRRWRVLPRDVRERIMAMSAEGATQREIIDALELSNGVVCRVLRPHGVLRQRAIWQPSAKSLTMRDRSGIRTGLDQGLGVRDIAKALGRAPSTVSRELARNGGAAGYDPTDAHERAYAASRRPKVSKLEANPRLHAEVESRLRRCHSPEQIAQRLREDYPDESDMWVSPETIYKNLYLQSRGALKQDLLRCLRTGRTTRKARERTDRGAAISNMVPIAERDPEADQDRFPGHWEGDLIIGERGQSAAGTLVERHSRRVVIVALPEGRRSEQVCERLVEEFQQMPPHLVRSLAWDQGTEMARHETFTETTGIQVYFCDPHSPWQRPTNENMNGLIRQFIPKGTDINRLSATELHEIQELLNDRPRKVLGWKTPNEVWAELVAATA